MTAPRYSVERTLSLPEFWIGAADARVEIYAADGSLLTGRGIVRAQAIETALRKGLPLAEIAEFHDWCDAGGAR